MSHYYRFIQNSTLFTANVIFLDRQFVEVVNECFYFKLRKIWLLALNRGFPPSNFAIAVPLQRRIVLNMVAILTLEKECKLFSEHCTLASRLKARTTLKKSNILRPVCYLMQRRLFVDNTF